MRTRRRESFGSQRSKTRKTRLLSIPSSNICQSFGTSSSEQCHLINICLLFSPHPSSLLPARNVVEAPASTRYPPTPYIRYIPYWSFERSFRYARPGTKTGRNAPRSRQEPDERGWDVTLPKLVTGQQRGHCIKYWLDRASSCRSLLRDRSESGDSLYEIALRLSPPRIFRIGQEPLPFRENACKYVVSRNWKSSSALTSSSSSGRKNFPIRSIKFSIAFRE